MKRGQAGSRRGCLKKGGWNPLTNYDNWKAGNTVNELTNMLINLNVPIVNNKNISRKHLGYKGLHLNNYGSSRLGMNLISVIKKL